MKMNTSKFMGFNYSILQGNLWEKKNGLDSVILSFRLKNKSNIVNSNQIEVNFELKSVK